MIKQLSGYASSLSVSGGKLIIKQGITAENHTPAREEYRPHEINFDGVVVYAQTGVISLSAIKWLAKQNISVTILNWDGRLLTQMNPPQSMNTKVKQFQYKIYDSSKRLVIAKEFIRAKIQNTEKVLLWLLERYPELRLDYEACNFKEAFSKINKAKTTANILAFEGVAANKHWEILGKTFPLKFEFENRNHGASRRPVNAVDPINALFNYSYAILESKCYAALNAANLDVYLGFLHESQPNKASLVYDFQEPFRWLIEVTVIKALESGIFVKADFLRTENWNIKLRERGSNKLIPLINQAFNETTLYKGKNWQWKNVIELKAFELADCLTGKTKEIKFTEPAPELTRIDDSKIRNKIKAISYAEWKKKGYSKASLFYMKKNVKENKNFKLYAGMKERIDSF